MTQRTADNRIDASPLLITKITKNGFSFVRFVSFVGNRSVLIRWPAKETQLRPP